MEIEKYTIEYRVFDSIEDLEQQDASLLAQAQSVTQFAYAPYSNFRVGAFARLVNGHTVAGTNQENAAFPAGICAERSLLATAQSLHPGVAIESIAISYDNLKGKSDHPISPCGICRQSLVEFQQHTGSPMRVILGGKTGKAIVLQDAALLLPFVFTGEDMKEEPA